MQWKSYSAGHSGLQQTQIKPKTKIQIEEPQRQRNMQIVII